MKNKITVKNQEISIVQDNYISLTDIAKYKDSQEANDIIRNWLRNRNTIEFLGLWEQLNNKDFKPVEFDGFRKEAGLNSFTMSPTKWINSTNAVGIISKAGRYGGTYAHQDIAFEFASWVSVEFKLYLIKEFQRLKNEEIEKQKLGWDIKRTIVKMNYHIHTDAIKNHLIPKDISKNKISFVYANEGDLLNIALFGKTAKQWKKENPEVEGNMRDYTSSEQLVVLANLENLNAQFIKENISEEERLIKLNQIAIEQINLLLKNKQTKIKKEL
jgi:hypothetical protein